MDIKQNIEKYISEKPIETSYFIFLLFGGLVFLIYYLDIQYLPELDLFSSVQLLSFVAITALLLLFFTIMMIIFPGVFWQYHIKKSFDQLNSWTNNQLNKNIWFIAPIVFIHISIFCCSYLSVKNYFHFTVWVLLLIFLNLLWITLFWYRAKKIIRDSYPTREVAKEYIYFVFLSFMSSGFSGLSILMLNLMFLQGNQQNITMIITMCIITLLIIISNLMVIAKPNHIKSIYWFSILGLTTFLCIILLTDQTARFPKSIMKTYKLGNIQPLSIIMNKEGCIDTNMTLEHHQIKNKEGKNIKFDIENDRCIISNITILWRIGKESYLELNNIKVKVGKETREYFRFPVSSSSIKRWNIIN